MSTIIIGSGVAGLSCALAAAAADNSVTLVTPVFEGEAVRGSTPLAQGGIACALSATDSPAAHLHDTLAVGHGLVDEEAATQLTFDGVGAVTRLLEDGLDADRDAHGQVLLGLEAAHGCHRIVHCGGDRSGAVLHTHLLRRAKETMASHRLKLCAGHTVRRLLLRDGAIAGVVLDDATVLNAQAVVIATGGYAALYPRSSNHPYTRGTGIALAARAGALIADMEFVQFHPTVLDPVREGERGFLVSEAVRGAGAVLRDQSGKRFMPRFDERAELAPRDVVSRGIDQVLRERGETHVLLDATAVPDLPQRFPQITAAISQLGRDWTREPIPVAPAAHYSMGGIATDLDGRTTIPGLYAVGEAASTGVHGANRLASNSLLEGLVFGPRAAAALTRPWEYRGSGLGNLTRLGTLSVPAAATEDSKPTELSKDNSGEDAVREVVGQYLGITRTEEGIAAASRASVTGPGSDSDTAVVAALIAAGAQARTESRGAHQRSDFPHLDPAQARRTAFQIKEKSTCSPRPSSAPPSPAPCKKMHRGEISAPS